MLKTLIVICLITLVLVGCGEQNSDSTKSSDQILSPLLSTSESPASVVPKSSLDTKESTDDDLGLIEPPSYNTIPTETSEKIESQIDGDFEGYEEGKVFVLMNGQIWKQTSFEYAYYYDYMPDVLIYVDDGDYKLLVNGTDEAVTVELLE